MNNLLSSQSRCFVYNIVCAAKLSECPEDRVSRGCYTIVPCFIVTLSYGTILVIDSGMAILDLV